MTQFDQKGQEVRGRQQNAGRDIINNIFPVVPWKPPVMLPPRAQSFVGREEDIAWLLEQFAGDQGKTLALCGPGGMGKTALAAEAVTRLMAQENWLEHFPGGSYYYSFYGSPSLDIAFEELARRFGEELGADPRRAAMCALSCRRTLLIFDGVEELADSFPLQELGGTHVVLLLSHHQSDAPDLAHRLDLDPLSPQQAITLLQKLAGSRAEDRSSVERLVEHIGGLPLALQVIGSYLSSHQQDVADYLEWFEEEGLATMDHGKHRHQSIPVLLRRTYDALESQERRLFVLLGLLAPAAFPLELVQGIQDLPKRTVQSALGSLVNYSVLRRPDRGDRSDLYEVSHPLVHAFAKEQKDEQNRQEWAVRIVRVLYATLPPVEPAMWPHWELIMPHAQVCSQHIQKHDMQFEEAIDLLDTTGLYLDKRAQYEKVEQWYQGYLNILEKSPDRVSLVAKELIVVRKLANVYSEIGEYEKAEALYQRSLRIFEQNPNLDPRQYARSLNSLAIIFKNQNKCKDAEDFYLHSLLIWWQHRETELLNFAQSLNNLAVLYGEQEHTSEHTRNYATATYYLKHSLKIQLRLMGADSRIFCWYRNRLANQPGANHDILAWSLNNLANLYVKQASNRVIPSQLFKLSQEIQERQLREDPAASAQSLHDLAISYIEQGSNVVSPYQSLLYKQARKLYQLSVGILVKNKGRNHPDVGYPLNGLAILYYLQGEYEKAEKLYEHGLSIWEQSLRPTHLQVAYSSNNLAMLHFVRGEYRKAERECKKALEIFQERLGSGHPRTLICAENCRRIDDA